MKKYHFWNGRLFPAIKKTLQHFKGMPFGIQGSLWEPFAKQGDNRKKDSIGFRSHTDSKAHPEQRTINTVPRFASAELINKSCLKHSCDKGQLSQVVPKDNVLRFVSRTNQGKL